MTGPEDPINWKYNPDFTAERDYLNRLAEALEKAKRIDVTPTLTSLERREGGEVVQISSELAEEIAKSCRKIVFKLEQHFRFK